MLARRSWPIPVPDRLGRRLGLGLGVAVVGLFLLTRLPLLDADIPRWELTWYSPIDELGYTVPAFNLVRYGTWVHQAAPWAPLEGPPINVLQNIVTAVTLGIGGNTYVGLRAASIVFALTGFLALVGILRRQAGDAVRETGVPVSLAAAVTVAGVALLLLDFSTILTARVAEPTTSRFAFVAVVLWLVARGSLLGERHGVAASAGLGALAAAGVVFVYVYNAFLVPAAFVALAWWAWTRGGPRATARHLVSFAVGGLAVTALFFVLYALVYGEPPTHWLRVWILDFATSSRGNGFALSKIASIAQANAFRLDPAFFGLALAAVGVFVWAVWRRPTGLGVFILAGLGFLVLQSGFVADYPERKFVMFLVFAVPIATRAILAWSSFQAWAVEEPRRIVVATLWLAGAIAVAAAAVPFGRAFPSSTTLARIVLVAGIAGLAALVVLLVSNRRGWSLAAAAVLGLSIAAPLVYTDVAFLYRRATFTYRDAQIAAAPRIDGRVTAGGWSLGMRLYNTSEPVLDAFPSHLPEDAYWAAVVRYFREHGAAGLFTYVNPTTKQQLGDLGFRVERTYDIRLPRDQVFGLWVFDPAGAASGSP